MTFYELLTGQLPFPTTDILEFVHCHIAKSPIRPHEANATIPKLVSDIVLKLIDFFFLMRLELVYENGQCILRVKDDGQGFEIGNLLPNRHLQKLILRCRKALV
ncbi:hypothetical protein, partial [Brasilonema octagenarum]|uniref:hypothetical protein n=1 Tax=Brasilonema octagenarum TaxID=417105 RepID=UPI001B7D09A5